MSTYTVKAATKKKDVDGQYGPMQVIALMLDNGTGATQSAEWFCKRDTPLPAEGSQLEGELESGNYGLNFKKARDNFGGGGGGMTPERQRAITRQHSQDMALTAIALVLPADNAVDGDTLRAAITDWADWFDSDVNTAAGVPTGGGGPSVSESPSPATDAAAGQNLGFRVKPDGTSPQKDYFESLLKRTPATPDTVNAIMAYAETLPNVSNLIDLLKEDVTATATAKQLAAEAQEWAANQPAAGEPDTRDLPEPEGAVVIPDDDGIPF